MASYPSQAECTLCGKTHRTRKIALEEATTTRGTEDYLPITLENGPTQEARAWLEKALTDQHVVESKGVPVKEPDARIEAMDKAGIERFVLSQTSPGVQAEEDPKKAVKNAKSANDDLYEQVQRHPKRYAAFAHLPMQDVTAACDELKRCVNDYGFLGALINGGTKGVYTDRLSYLDEERYRPFWETVEELSVPVYLHPANPFPQPQVLEGFKVLQNAVWGWTTENSSHFLRMLFSGLFDRHSSLTIILGHMGETLPYFAWRIDSRYEAQIGKDKDWLEKKPSDYFRSNLIITTSGVCQDSALRCALDVMGESRILFSVDYPYEDPEASTCWIETTKVLTEEQRRMICYDNAARVLRRSDSK